MFKGLLLAGPPADAVRQLRSNSGLHRQEGAASSPAQPLYRDICVRADSAGRSEGGGSRVSQWRCTQSSPGCCCGLLCRSQA